LETHVRAIAKAISYRLFGSFVTFAIVFIVAREIKLAVGIGVADTVLKIFAFYFHERLWNKIKFGKTKPPEYQI